MTVGFFFPTIYLEGEKSGSALCQHEYPTCTPLVVGEAAGLSAFVCPFELLLSQQHLDVFVELGRIECLGVKIWFSAPRENANRIRTFRGVEARYYGCEGWRAIKPVLGRRKST